MARRACRSRSTAWTHDPFFADEGDIDAARAARREVGPAAELFVYPGDQHLFADSSLPSYDAEAAALMTERVLDFLGQAARRDRSGPPRAGAGRRSSGCVSENA